MTRSLSNTSAFIEVDGCEYGLAPDRDLVDVMSQIESAARAEPTFVDLSNGERMVSVLISARSRVVVTVRPDPTPSATDDWPLDLPSYDWE